MLLQKRTPPIFCVFDLDGTLINTAPTTIKVLNEMLIERGGVIHESKDFDRFLSTGGKDIVGAVLGCNSNDLEGDIVEFRSRLSNITIPKSDIYSGITELLSRLQKHGNRLAVCTNKPQNLALKTLDDVGLLDFFEIIIGSSETHKSKPDTEMLDLIQYQFACKKSSMVCIGDSEIDQEMAHNACVDYVHLTHGYGSVNTKISMPIQVFSQVDSMVYDFLISRD